MNTFLIIIVISCFTLLGSVYAKKYQSADLLIALYVLFTALSQIIASKIAVFDLGITKVTAPAAVVIFAVTFLITDLVNEKFGQKQVHLMIGITFVTQVAMMAFLYIASNLEPAAFWQYQEAWSSILGTVPRILIASWITFLVSENLDAWIFSIVRKITKGKHLWARNVFSTIPALTVDTLIFVTIAFAGTGLPLWEIMTGQFLVKYSVGIMNIPFMYFNRFFLGKRLVND